jgi:hypothetical protein
MLPYWQLLSVLFSSFPLTPSLAMTLYEAAFELHAKDQASMPVAGDVVSGTVRNLRKHAMLGAIGGPTFEAEVETDRGRGTVRFLLTSERLAARGNVTKVLRY